MGVTEQQELFTDGTVPRHAQFAVSCVPEHSLHLDTAWLLAHRVTTLACMNKELDALLNGGLALFSGVFLGCVLLNFVVQTKAKLVHHMYVPNITIAGNTEVKILVWRRRGGREGVREGVTR